MKSDPTSFQQVKRRSNLERWIKVMKEEMKSMTDNDIWKLVELLKGAKSVCCKWIFKTKRNSKSNIEKYKVFLIAKGFTQKVGINYNETFSHISMKDSFKIIMILVIHYNLELYQMDIKTAFLNGEVDEIIYMMQLENFKSKDSKHPVCRLKKFIYGLKWASRQ